MKKENKKNILKKAGIATLLAAGLTVAGGIFTHGLHNARSDKTDETENIDAYANLTTRQIEDYIEKSDIALESLQKVIESKDSNPEERFDARRAYNSILKTRKEMQKELERRQKSTINYKDVNTKSR